MTDHRMEPPFISRMRAAYRYRRTIGHGRLNCLRYVLSPRYLRASRG